MNLTNQIAKHFRDVHFGGNWTSVNLKETLTDVTWQQATTKIYSLNTIATLVFHINYYISAVTKVLQGEPLTAHDKYSLSSTDPRPGGLGKTIEQDMERCRKFCQVDRTIARRETWRYLFRRKIRNLL